MGFAGIGALELAIIGAAGVSFSPQGNLGVASPGSGPMRSPAQDSCECRTQRVHLLGATSGKKHFRAKAVLQSITTRSGGGGY